MVWDIEKTFFCLNKNNVSIVENKALTTIPKLEWFVSQFGKQPTPEIKRFFQVSYIDFNVMESSFHSSLPRQYILPEKAPM